MSSHPPRHTASTPSVLRGIRLRQLGYLGVLREVFHGFSEQVSTGGLPSPSLGRVWFYQLIKYCALAAYSQKPTLCNVAVDYGISWLAGLSKKLLEIFNELVRTKQPRPRETDVHFMPSVSVPPIYSS